MSKVVAVALVLALGIVQVADGFGTGSLLPLKTSGRSVAGCSSLKMSTNPDMNSEKKELNTRRGVVGGMVSIRTPGFVLQNCTVLIGFA